MTQREPNPITRLLSAGAALALVLACAGPAPALLYEKGGGSGLGARTMGMAGAATAVGLDSSVLWWNPAGLSDVDDLRLDSSFGTVYDGRVRQFGFSAAYPLPSGAA